MYKFVQKLYIFFIIIITVSYHIFLLINKNIVLIVLLQYIKHYFNGYEKWKLNWKRRRIFLIIFN